MFDKDKVFFKCEDYTVRMERIDGCEKYFIKLHGHSDMPEQEINADVFMLYYKEFRKPFDKMQNEQRRHIEIGKIDSFIKSGKLTLNGFEKAYSDKAELDAALKTCTQIQQRRFTLHYLQGYSVSEVADMEHCDISVVSRSIASAEKKIKKYYSA